MQAGPGGIASQFSYALTALAKRAGNIVATCSVNIGPIAAARDSAGSLSRFRLCRSRRRI
jgi:hypothetical protein